MIRRIKSSLSLPKRFKSTYLSLQRKKRPVTKFHREKSEVSISLRENSQINEISFQLQTLVEPEREIFHQKSTKEMEGGRLVAVDFLFRRRRERVLAENRGREVWYERWNGQVNGLIGWKTSTSGRVATDGSVRGERGWLSRRGRRHETHRRRIKERGEVVLVPKLVLRPAIPVEEASTNNTCRDGSRIGTPIAVSPNLFFFFFFLRWSLF